MNSETQKGARKMKNITAKIRNYLSVNGPMSGEDIASDLNLSEIDIEFARQENAIKHVKPPVNASSFPWFATR
jgi:hypothetical protein